MKDICAECKSEVIEEDYEDIVDGDLVQSTRYYCPTCHEFVIETETCL